MKKEVNQWHDGSKTPPPATQQKERQWKKPRWNQVINRFFSMEIPEPPMGAHAPPYEIYESPRQYLMALDMPGVQRSDLQVEIEGHELKISAERHPQAMAEQTGVSPTRGRPRYGRLRRSFTLPLDVELEEIVAYYQDGVLTLAIPKQSQPTTRRVEIFSGTAPEAGPKLVTNLDPTREKEAI